MKKRTFFVVVTFGLLTWIACSHACTLAGQKPERQTVIHADEIGRSVSVLGNLGVPLRSVVSVNGVWVELTETSKPGSSLWVPCS